MTEPIVVRRPNDTWTEDAIGKETQGYDLLFSEVGKLQTRTLQLQESDAGGRRAGVVRMEAHLPVDTAALRANDTITFTLRGRTFRVLGPFEKTYMTARRYEVEEVVA